MSDELDLMSKVMLVNSAHEIFGKKAARNLWRSYGLPDCSEFIPKEEAWTDAPAKPPVIVEEEDWTIDRMKEMIVEKIKSNGGRASADDFFKMFGKRYNIREIKDVCVMLQCEWKITCKNIYDKDQSLQDTVYMMMDKKP